MDSPDDLSLVSSLYGPGNWCCWYLTIISVFFTWTFNIESKRKDSITNDFLASLAIPCVAAGHLIWLVFFTGTIRLVDYVDYSASEIRDSHPAVVKHLLAAEGPLRICRVFTILHMPLALISAIKGHDKRMWYTLLAGILVTVAQESVQWWSIGEAALPSEERPPVFRPFSRGLCMNFTSFHVALIIVCFAQPTLDKMKCDLSCEGDYAKAAERPVYQQEPPRENDCEDVLPQQPMDDHEEKVGRKAPCYRCLVGKYLGFQVPLIFIACSGLSDELKADGDNGSALLPKSSISITELDQVVALMVGLITLGCGLRDIMGAHRREMKKREKAKIHEETGLGEERLLYLDSIVTRWIQNQREVQVQLRSGQACNGKLECLMSQNKIFMKIMAREKLLERGSMEYQWLRRKIDKQVIEDAIKSIQRPAKVYVPGHRTSRDQVSNMRARNR